MRFGIPKDLHRHEHRVGLTPFGAARLTSLGHQVYLESGAGDECHFSDSDFAEAGAQTVYSRDEVYQRSDVVCRVRALDAEDVRMLRAGSIVCAFHHLAVARKEVIHDLVEREITVIGYEIIEDATGQHPVLSALSEIAGRMTVHLAAELLQFESGGRGVLLGGVPGVPPATAVILGAGTVGRTAARALAACGAHVIVLDGTLANLRRVSAEIPFNIVTAIASKRNLERYSAIADVLIGCVLIPGGRAPFLVTEEMVKRMKPGAAILDISIDQGGCIETSRPTTLDNPTFRVHGVTHYCVPNMTTNVPRTASRVLTIAALQYLVETAEKGVEAALRSDPGLAKGVYLYRGRFVHQPAATALGMQAGSLETLLAT
ncbi:MAG: alanine dehydrogenase [Planctomycetota bacterium]